MGFNSGFKGLINGPEISEHVLEFMTNLSITQA